MGMTGLNKGWKFIKEDQVEFSKVMFDDSTWRDVTIPHDYAVEGPFSKDNDVQYKKVIADGIMDAILHVGRTSGLPIGESAWYRKHFSVSDKAKKVFLEFDGIMNNSSVYVNGDLVGSRHFGYTSFSYDVTDYVNKGEENVVAVRVAPQECASRWYPGAGIYRFVRLVEKNEVYIPYNGTYITSELEEDSAVVHCEIKVCDSDFIDLDKAEIRENAILQTIIFDQAGKEVAVISTDSLSSVNKQEIRIETPRLWDIDAPNLYVAVTNIVVDGEVMDSYQTVFGIRTIEFDATKGFFLNGRHVKLKGVCMHHDLGALGTAVNVSAMRRQLEKLQTMGCNAIRTSHNPPAPEYLDLCDLMGFLVLDESFDEWRYPKVDNGYSNYFEEWAEKDLVDLIHRDRNHPCVIMWSIGNEILDQHHEDGAATAKWLNDICHREDRTRPTTAGFNNSDAAIKNGLCDEVDIVGFNYKPHLYEQYHKEHPEWIIYGSETESCVSSRGEYELNPKVAYPADLRDNCHIPSFDLEGPPWACSPDTEFEAQDQCAFSLGEFVWTGFDYLGEPTPYREEWPSRSSYFGILDLAGMEKDRYYSYQSKWADVDVLHLMPHWNWSDGDQVDVHCYSSFDRVELFLNGESLGIREKHDENAYTKHRLVWENVHYERGTLTAVAVDKPEVTCEVKTAKVAYAIRLSPEKKFSQGNSEDLCYIRCDIIDEDGTICPNASNRVDIKTSGSGQYVASDAGDQTSLRMFTETYCKAFHGSLMIIVKGDDKGTINIQVNSEGLTEGHCEVEVL